MTSFTSLIQHSIGSPSHSDQTRRRNKRHPNWKGSSQTVFIHRCHDSVHREPQRIHQETTINQFSNVAGYKINIQKSVVFLHANDKLTEREIKKTVLFTTASIRIKYLGINLIKDVKTYTWEIIRH